MDLIPTRSTGRLMYDMRRAANLTQQQVSERLHMANRSYISWLEGDMVDVRMDTLRRFAEACGCTLIIGFKKPKEEDKNV